MRPAAPIERDIVLVGGGHAHVDVVKRFGMRPEPGVRVTLVARDSLTPYSGMIPGLLRGVYGHADCHIDLGRICRWAGVGLVRAAATGLDLVGQCVEIAGRPPLAYDLLSIDVGSTPPAAGIAGADEFALSIKPLDRFLARLDEMDRSLPDGARLAVAGAGAGGVVTALGLKRRFERQGKPVRMTLLSADAAILPGHADAVRARMLQALADAGVEVRTGAAVAAVAAEGATLADGAEVPAEVVVLATGAAAPAWLAASGLAVDDGGFVRVDRFLRSPSHPEVFAAGDCAAFDPRPLDKSGVYAVRAGPPLAGNLRRAAIGEPLEPWRPQRRTLALMSTGDGGAVVSYGRLAMSGRWAWRWKDRIDRRWMDKYRDLPPMKPEPLAAAELAAPAQMRSGGCGAKVASPILRRALAELGLADAAGDDAAILEPRPGEALVQTVDQFRSFIDDPFLFGEIATVHALGDLYAMGAEPDSALATAILPHAGDAATERDL
ncbi:MAG: FAD-dependent oxidoreductase, partial [Alphaproteobacteria bacterium]